jgi:hypothetical protein
MFPPEWPECHHATSIDNNLRDRSDANLNVILDNLIDETAQEWIIASNLIRTERQARQNQQVTSPVAGSSTDPFPDEFSVVDTSTSTEPFPDEFGTDTVLFPKGFDTASIPSTNTSLPGILSQATTGSVGMSELYLDQDTSSTFSVATATITKHPHIFLSIMYRILQSMENWNEEDSILPLSLQTEANKTWVYHSLSSSSEWSSLTRQRRSALVCSITKVINDKITFDPKRLGVAFSQESTQQIQALVEKTQLELRQGSFRPPTYLVKFQSRLFTLAPIPGFTLKYIRINHASFGMILKFCGLQKYAAMVRAPNLPDGTHPNFKIINLKKFKGYVYSFIYTSLQIQ